MDLLMFIFLMAVIMIISDGLIVHGPSGPLVAPLGSSVVLSCYVDKPLPMEGLEVEWRRTDSETLVHLYQDGESRPEAQHQEYHDRAHFFTDQIQHGNFSLRLDKLRAEDEGKYTCKVHSHQDSGETVLQIKDVERLLVSGSSPSISVSVGEDVTLNCSVDSHITPEHIEEVSWRKTDDDILVLLYQNNQTVPDLSDERYRDRAEFFIDEIPKGNISLRLKSVRTEDKGVYMCQVFAGGSSANATVVLERLGFSVSHIMVLILCISASGAALLLCCLIYCRPQYKGFIVQHSSYLVVSLGSSVVLPCHVDKCLLKKSLKVEWRRTDSETLVHLYQDGESRAEAQHQDYHDRAHFFTDQIQHGNFSLHLDNLRTEDEGKYTTRVYSDQDCVHSAITELVEGFAVEHSSHTPVPLGGSVVLPCFVDELMEGLKVEWRRTDSETLVHLFLDGESRPEVQHQDYHDRAHFCTDQIQHRNFSLRLDNLRAEDEGKYTCKVYNEQDSVFSAETNLELRLLNTVFRLQMFLVFFPNILMFLAFVLWGVSEGSLNESVSCCALYFLRPFMLLWAAPYIKELTSNTKTWILDYSYEAQYAVFSAIVYSALFKSAWNKNLKNARFESIVVTSLFVIVLLFNLIYIIFLLVRFIKKLSERQTAIFNVLARINFDFLPSLQFILLFYAFGSVNRGFFIVSVLPILLTMTRYNWDQTCGENMRCSPLVEKSVWLIFMLLLNTVMVYFYILLLETEKDRVEWTCLIGFLQLLWTVIDFTRSFDFDFPCAVPLYLFGSIVVVLLTSVTLMTELILKTVKGYGVVGDLRVVVFSSEFLFTFSLLILTVFAPWKMFLQSCQNAVESYKSPANGSNQNRNTAESHETNPFLKTEDQEANRSDVKEKTDSVESQA